MYAIVEGKQVKVGDSVCFKSDIEQCGTIVRIERATWGNGHVLYLESKYGFEGEYIGGQKQTVERAADCWVE